MFSNVFPHKVPFKEQKDEDIFEEAKVQLKKLGLECINLYAAFENRDGKAVLKFTVMLRNSLGIIPDDEILINKWNELCQKYSYTQYVVDHAVFVYISSDALALEKNVRDQKNKIYVSKLVHRYTKATPYKVLAFNTAISNESNNERTGLYYYSSGYNIVMESQEDYESAIKKKDQMVEDISTWINKLCSETTKRKSGAMPIIRFLYKDLVEDIDSMDKENEKQF